MAQLLLRLWFKLACVCLFHKAAILDPHRRGEREWGDRLARANRLTAARYATPVPSLNRLLGLRESLMG
jgi:hypothetical protein